MQQNWLSEAFIYHLLIDRFYGSTMMEPEKPHFAGGTIAGIIEKIDYIKQLGVTCLWISPFYTGLSYHGYHITDYYSVDHHFGTMHDLEKLIAVAHNNNLKIIADLVPNHCSIQHPFFKDAKHNKKSIYRNWFYIDEKTDDYLSFLGFKELAKINLDNAEARSYFIENAKFWLSKGFDGFRIDHIIGVSRTFLADLNSELKTINPSSILIGEAWIEGISKKQFKTLHIKNSNYHKLLGISQESIQKQYQGLIDGVLDFEARNILITHFVRASKSEAVVMQQLQKHFKHYDDAFGLVLFLDNHDTNRIMFECNNDAEKVKQLFKILKKCKKPVVLYSGTEDCLSHNESIQTKKPYADLDVRQPMNWMLK